MQEYSSTIKSIIGDAQHILLQIDSSNKEKLFLFVKNSNKIIASAFVNSFPKTSLPEIVDYYLTHYRYSCIRSERHSQTQRYSIRLESTILPFSAVMQQFSTLFYMSGSLEKLNNALFYAIMQIDGAQINREKVAEQLSNTVNLTYGQLSISFLEKALRQFLFLVSDGNIKFVNTYGKRRNVKLINQQIFISKCKNISDIYKILESPEFYKEIAPSNILGLLVESLVRDMESAEESERNITRHPTWCYHNITGNGKCKELNIICHTTVGCPFFQKAKRLPSGATQMN